MLQPMGLPENVRVIAWGLSLERPTMIKYGIPSIRGILTKDGEKERGRGGEGEGEGEEEEEEEIVLTLRDIFGPLTDLNFIKTNPIAFIDSREVHEAHAAPPHAPPIK